MTSACASRTATSRANDDEHLLRLAIRAEYDGAPPPGLRRWLDEQGVEV